MNIFQPQTGSADLDLERDFISNLPTNLKEEIIMKLPIKEAVRTSLLSTKWKNVWMLIPNLVFKEGCAQSELIRLVDQVVLVHRGPILQFELVSKHLCNEANEAIDRWMLILSRNGIRNIYIKRLCRDDLFIPSSFFSCLALETVHISHGFTIHVPPSFLGFKFLHTLRLVDFNLTGIAVTKLISSCPLLEILELTDFDNFGHFVIRAPNLKWLSIMGDFVDLCFETPKLFFAKIYLCGELEYENLPSKNCKSNILRVLGSLTAIEQLELCSEFITVRDQYLRKVPIRYLEAKGPVPEVLLVPFHRLTELHIEFFDIYEEQAAAVFCLFKSSPNLKVLSLTLPFEENDLSSSVAQSFWEVKGKESNFFNCLQIVKITYFAEYPESTLKVAQFILRTAPVLEKLVMREMYRRIESRSFLKKLASFPRLSKMAEIVFVEDSL